MFNEPAILYMRFLSSNPTNQLSSEQRIQLAAYQEQLLYLNRRVNLISRESEQHLEEQHVQHVLALAYKQFPPGAAVVDWGTGGGLPAIPLAIIFPEITVYAVDAVGKKIHAVRTIVRRLGLTNVHPWIGRAEEWPGTAQYSVSRATAPLADLWRWHARIRTTGVAERRPDTWGPGLVCLKGGDLTGEVDALHQAFPSLQVVTTSLQQMFEHSYYAGKVIVEVFDD